jgi:hypothetical protein
VAECAEKATAGQGSDPAAAPFSGGAPVKRIIALERAIRDSASFALRGTAVKSVSASADIWPLRRMRTDGAGIQQSFINASQAMSGAGY